MVDGWDDVDEDYDDQENLVNCTTHLSSFLLLALIVRPSRCRCSGVNSEQSIVEVFVFVIILFCVCDHPCLYL